MGFLLFSGRAQVLGSSLIHVETGKEVGMHVPVRRS